MPSRCAQCGTGDTPCWREGPDGARTLCNACGIRWKRHVGGSKRSSRSNSRSVSPVDTSAILATRTRPKAAKVAKRHFDLDDEAFKPVKAVCKKVGRARGRKAERKIMVAPSEMDQLLQRLDTLEATQLRTNQRLRLVSERLMEFHMRSLGEGPLLSDLDVDHDEDHYFLEDRNAQLESRIEVMMEGDGESEAHLLARLRCDNCVCPIPGAH